MLRSLLKVGLVPVWNDPTTGLQLELLRRELGRLLGLTVHVQRYAKPEELADALDQGEVELAWTSPILALTHPALTHALPFASAVRQDSTHYHSVLFTLPDSAIEDVHDLRGRSVAWVAPTSAAGYVFPRVALAALGLDPMSLFRVEMYCYSHGAVVDTVVGRQADLGATFAVFEAGDASKPLLRAGFLDGEHAHQVRILLVSPPVPSDLWLIREATDVKLAGHVLGALQELCVSSPNAMLSVFGAENYIECEPSSLRELREAIDHARSLDLLDVS